MRKQNIQDERILTQKRKISSEAFTLLWLALLGAILIQQFLFNAPFAQYAVESICFTGASIYILVRNIMIGNNLFNTPKSAKKLVAINSGVCGLTITIVNGVLNYLDYEKKYNENLGMFVLTLVITFTFATFAAFAVNVLIYQLNKNRQKQIAKILDEEDSVNQ